MTRQIVYLHGFASSARSSKAVWFAERAREAGVGFVCPDLNLPDFGAPPSANGKSAGTSTSAPPDAAVPREQPTAAATPAETG